MPTYAYRCPACTHEFDVFQKISDPAGAPCPVCGTAAERIITGGGGVIFKGGGFYLTDYRSESYKKAAKSESGEGGGGAGASGEAKTDSGSGAKPTEAKPAAADSTPEPKPKPKAGDD